VKGDEMNERAITAEMAIRRLPPGDTIHTFLGNIGADWPRQQLIDAIKASGAIYESGGFYASMGHGVIINHGGKTLAIETD
jgi:hypothetical protein